MYRMKSTRPIHAAALAIVLAAPIAHAQDDGASASEEWTQSIEKIETSGAEQRNEAVGAGESIAEAMDQRIEAMEQWVARNWDKLSAEAREDRQEIISDLRKQRNDLAEWFGAMKHSSAESWEEAKQGFVDVYNTMGEKFNAVVDKFESKDAEQ